MSQTNKRKGGKEKGILIFLMNRDAKNSKQKISKQNQTSIKLF